MLAPPLTFPQPHEIQWFLDAWHLCIPAQLDLELNVLLAELLVAARERPEGEEREVCGQL